jgi:adenylate cyclase
VRHAEASKRWPKLKIGVGINTGVAVVGNIGSSRRMEFTAIGDTINLASRLEQATKDIDGVDILVSEYTYVAVRSNFPFIPVGSIPVRGKSEPIRTYTVQEQIHGVSEKSD